jgi:hypothetical protein
MSKNKTNKMLKNLTAKIKELEKELSNADSIRRNTKKRD